MTYLSWHTFFFHAVNRMDLEPVAQKSVINIQLYWTFIVKNVVKCWSYGSLQNCHMLKVLLKPWQRFATSTLIRCVCLRQTLCRFSPPPPRIFQIVLFLWLIKCYTKCSRWWWAMPLAFQCREIFKLVCTCNQTRLVIFFPPELS